jgi:hypothetical protein
MGNIFPGVRILCEFRAVDFVCCKTLKIDEGKCEVVCALLEKEITEGLAATASNDRWPTPRVLLENPEGGESPMYSECRE